MIVWKASQSCQLCSGSLATSADSLVIASGCHAMKSRCPAGRPPPSRRPSSPPRRALIEIGAGPGIVALMRVLAGDDVGLGGGDLRLQRKDAGGARLRIGQARQLHQLRQIGLIGGADLRHFGLVGQVIVAVGQAQAALHQIGDVARRLVQVLADEQAEQVVGAGVVVVVERVGIRPHRRADRARQVALVLDCGDGGKARLDRRQPARLDTVRVGIGGIIIGDPLLVAARCALGRGGTLDDRGGAGLGAQRHVQPDADRRAVGRDFGGLAPAAIGIGVEIVARLHAGVHIGLVHAGSEPSGHGGGGDEKGGGERVALHDGPAIR